MKASQNQFTYRLHEGELALPAGWSDQSMQVFRKPGQDGRKDASLVITRDYETSFEDVKQYVKRQQDVMKKQFPGFKVLREGELTLDGQPSALLEYEWSPQNTTLRQRQAFLRCPDCVLTLTLSAMSDEFSQHEETWSLAVSSFKVRRDSDAPEKEPKRSA